MKNKKCIVVTNTQIGWDNVIGVYENIEDACNDLREGVETTLTNEEWMKEVGDIYIFHEKRIK